MIRPLPGIGRVLVDLTEIEPDVTSAAMYSAGQHAIQLSMGQSGTPPAR